MLWLVYVLCFDGIVWLQCEDGVILFKFEYFVLVNDVCQGDVYEVLLDVYVIIGMVWLFKQLQLWLWEYVLKLCDKCFVVSLFDVDVLQLVLYVFMCYLVQCMCVVLVLFIVWYLYINNWIIVLDLEGDIDGLFVLLVDMLVVCLYMCVVDLVEGEQCVLFKEVYLNKVLVLVVWNYLCLVDYVCLGIDVVVVDVNVVWVCEVGLVLVEKVWQVYGGECMVIVSDVDVLLYDGFFVDGDKVLMFCLCISLLLELVGFVECLKDLCMFELLFCYWVCNYLQMLDVVECGCWNDYWWQCLLGDVVLGEQILLVFCVQLDSLVIEYVVDFVRLVLLFQFGDWGIYLE